MEGISFNDFAEAFQAPILRPRPRGRLLLPAAPDPFVPPPLRLMESSVDTPLDVEVLFIEASAAVGKSTMAQYLAATRGVPLLDLSVTGVSTHSLVGILTSELEGEKDPEDAFHSGEIPVAVDALDEGRLLSGESGIEGFLETTSEFILSDRSVTDRPKLVFFGRPESIELARVGLELSGSGVTTTVLGVDFFDEQGARQLIDAYARASADPAAPYFKHPRPVAELIDTYFASIEAALSLDPGTLWRTDRGRAFAGYAPVLAAVGYILAKIDQFHDVVNLLESRGAQEAWDVIESVLHTILIREQGKLTEKLSQQLAVEVPHEAYDSEEQLFQLSRLIHGQPLSASGRIRLSPADQAKYNSMVEQYLPEHPFIRQGEPANSVLGSLVLAYAIVQDMVPAGDYRLLDELSRQPFLWRSAKPRLDDDTELIDGRYVGHILASLWNDPGALSSHVRIRDAEAGAALVSIEGLDGRTEFRATLPLGLSGEIRDCDVRVGGSVQLLGRSHGQESALLYVYGPMTLIAQALDVQADIVFMTGQVWLEANEVTAAPRMDLRVKDGAEFGWGGAVGDTYPWNRFASTIAAPYVPPVDDVVAELVEECARRLAMATTLTLHPDFSVADDPRMGWVTNRFGAAFPALIRALRDEGLVRIETMSASGSPKVRVRVEVPWSQLRAVLRGEVRSREIERVMAALRQELA